MKKFSLLLLLQLFVVVAWSQKTITGKVVDENGEGLSNVEVLFSGKTERTIQNGQFTINVAEESGKLTFKLAFYNEEEISFNFDGNNSISLGNILLVEMVKNLKEIIITSKGVIDVEESRKTPIAVSTLDLKEIQAKAGNSDLPELLKSTPSVQNIRGGGYGDGAMYLRGFDQTNTAFLINGQPINGMEDGKMYWSNWSGVLDIANAIQVQRGLGSSKLAISSVGGTTNILIKTVDLKAGGFASTMIGNDNFVKATAFASTGMSKKGWAFSAMMSHWQGDGYVNNTQGQGQTYYFSVGYKPKENHIFNFLITGAPQWHNAAGSHKLIDYLSNGFRYNGNNTKYQGSLYPGGRNFYHKPIANLTWDWTISKKAALSTVLYGSIGRGGFASTILNSAKDSILYTRGSYNNHNWGGLVTNYNYQINKNMNINVGADARFYNGIHFRAVTDFFYADSVKSTNALNGTYYVNENYGSYDPWLAVLTPNNDGKQHLGYDYEENINYAGIFGQFEYVKSKVSAFFQGALSSQSHIKTDMWNYSTIQKSDKVANLGYNIKAGGSYQFNEKNKVFLNAGLYSRQPFHDELFNNMRTSNDLRNPEVVNQDISSIELGYQYTGKKLRVNINVYNTLWGNRTLSSDNGKTDPTLFRAYQMQNVNQNHSGAEIDFIYKASNRLTFKGFYSIGNWVYKGNATRRIYNDAGDDLTDLEGGSDTLYLDGVKVGGAAQTTAGFSFNMNIDKNWSVDGNLNYFNKLYSNVGASENTIILPNYTTFDLGISYKLKLAKKESFLVRLNVVNLFDKQFIESSTTSIAATNDDKTWNGVNTANNVRFGYGRTWNLTLRYNF
jgi:hypothetical protein